jgi:hypothetical protein
MRFKFIEENRAALPADRLCQIMNVSRVAIEPIDPAQSVSVNVTTWYC